jgi:hypothetical protein
VLVLRAFEQARLPDHEKWQGDAKCLWLRTYGAHGRASELMLVIDPEERSLSLNFSWTSNYFEDSLWQQVSLSTRYKTRGWFVDVDCEENGFQEWRNMFAYRLPFLVRLSETDGVALSCLAFKAKNRYRKVERRPADAIQQMVDAFAQVHPS